MIKFKKREFGMGIKINTYINLKETIIYIGILIVNFKSHDSHFFLILSQKATYY